MASNVPASWKSFRSVEEYEAFLKDPSRVVRLEWRKARRQQHKGLTSHSWLEAHLLDSRRLRLEFYADTALTESIFEDGKGERESVLYEERAAGAHDFARPLTADRLRRVATASARRPYSLTDWNCHHFVLDVWNTVVIDMLRRSHYPDRVKTSFLWGATESLGKLFGGTNSWLASTQGQGQHAETGPVGKYFMGSFSSRADGVNIARRGNHEPVPLLAGDDDPAEPPPHVCVEARHEGGGRVSGEVSSMPSTGYGKCFENALDQGGICLLEPGVGLVVTALQPDLPRTARAWADVWLPVEREVGVRLAEQLGTVDVVDLVARIVAPHTDTTVGRHMAKLRLASLNSESLASGQPGNVISACFVVLRGSELRLAVYAVLEPLQCQGQRARLRLLSGDAHAEQQGSFTYTLQDLKQDGYASAKSCAEDELNSLQIALSTGDWGFVTLL